MSLSVVRAFSCGGVRRCFLSASVTSSNIHRLTLNRERCLPLFIRGGGLSNDVNGSPSSTTSQNLPSSSLSSLSSSSSLSCSMSSSVEEKNESTSNDSVPLPSSPPPSEYAEILGNLKPSTFGSLPFLYAPATQYDKASSLTQSSSQKKEEEEEAKRQIHHKVIFILGGPGAGKGTQCANIVEKYKCVHLSAGELLRAAKDDPTNTHSALISDCLVQGSIVPVEISLGLLKDAMDAAATSLRGGSTAATNNINNDESCGAPIFLIDGFPRNFDNLKGWTSIMPKLHSTSLYGTLLFDCPVEILEQRILSRGETSGRSDDNRASAQKRFHTFREQTGPVVETLEKEVPQCQTVHIDGSGTVQEVWEETQQAMDGFVKNDVLSANTDLFEAIRTRDWEWYGKLVAPDMINPAKMIDDNEEETEASSVVTVTPESMECVPNMIREEPVTNAEVNVYGTTATVAYDRKFLLENDETVEFRETRTWRHVSNGWITVHFSRAQ